MKFIFLNFVKRSCFANIYFLNFIITKYLFIYLFFKMVKNSKLYNRKYLFFFGSIFIYLFTKTNYDYTLPPFFFSSIFFFPQIGKKKICCFHSLTQFFTPFCKKQILSQGKKKNTHPLVRVIRVIRNSFSRETICNDSSVSCAKQ